MRLNWSRLAAEGPPHFSLSSYNTCFPRKLHQCQYYNSHAVHFQAQQPGPIQRASSVSACKVAPKYENNNDYVTEGHLSSTWRVKRLVTIQSGAMATRSGRRQMPALYRTVVLALRQRHDAVQAKLCRAGHAPCCVACAALRKAVHVPFRVPCAAEDSEASHGASSASAPLTGSNQQTRD
jgi:hypothetical protein